MTPCGSTGSPSLTIRPAGRGGDTLSRGTNSTGHIISTGQNRKSLLGVDFKISLNQNTHKPHSLRCFTSTNKILLFFPPPKGDNFLTVVAELFRFSQTFGATCSHIPGSGTHLIGSFGGHFPPLFLINSVTLRTWGRFSFENNLGECALFPFQLDFSAQLPPRRAALFYFIRHDEKHVTKNRMESPKFMILSSLPGTLKPAQLGVEPWEKLAATEGRRAPGRDVWWLTSGWKVAGGRHHRGGAR